MSDLQNIKEKRIVKYNNRIAFRSISTIVALLIIFALILGYIGYNLFSRSTLEQYEDGALLTAYTAADIIDGEDLYRYNQSNGDSGDYRKAYNELQRLCNSSNSAFIYVIQPDLTDYRHIRFIFSIASYDSGFTPYEFGYLRETTNDEYREKYRELYEQRKFSEIVVRDSGYIETKPHITAMIPLRGSDNKVKGILCVQRQLEELTEIRHRYINQVIFVLIMLAFFTIVIESLFLHRTLLDPLNTITQEAKRFARDNVRAENTLADKIKNTDEIGLLAESIDKQLRDDRELLIPLPDQCRLDSDLGGEGSKA